MNEAESLKGRIEKELAAQLTGGDAYNHSVWEAMEYSLMAGGKRVRPLLLMWTGLSLGADEAQLLPFALSLEMIHTYSLIHDDLPAMDNDDYRRGRLTNHKVYGEANAILAGDGLLNLAFETMTEAMEQAAEGHDSQRLQNMTQAMAYMARCAGPSGMIAGQAADLASEGRQIDLEELTYIEYNKTSRLLMAALVCGALLAGAEPEVIACLETAGGALGKAFQIWDDVLDVEGSLEELGKEPSSDAASQKATFVSCYGIEKAKEEALVLTQKALDALKVLPGAYGEEVRRLTAALIKRRN
ncbi:MAG: polyprenyl synthetase family protein [Lachnospiraceae bacterium]|jgi:geranylgeranyl diphosphate synthase type II|nr:polyprenyl synthetase family protein [Lachnospiraceae bacterium]